MQAQWPNGASAQSADGSEAADDLGASSKPQSTPNGSLLSSLSGASEVDDSLLGDFREQVGQRPLASLHLPSRHSSILGLHHVAASACFVFSIPFGCMKDGTQGECTWLPPAKPLRLSPLQQSSPSLVGC